ncbi:MAG TPA: dihydropteroate synthase [Candidatus Saccharimonadales bacterium]
MTELVGILNITPDSFSDGGDFVDPTLALERARRLFEEGAAMVDVGAESTRPNATKLTPDEEWERLSPVLPHLLDEFPGRISLDTYHPETVRRAWRHGEVIVNDVTGMNNPRMQEVVVQLGAKAIISHLPGIDIQAAHHSEELVDSIEIVKEGLLGKAELLISAGLPKSSIILDPGIGFGKTMELNWELLKFGDQLPDYPVMIGYSRKRFLGANRMELEPNLEAGRIAIKHGAAYLRVHDVGAHRALLD